MADVATVVMGVLVFVIGQSLQRFILEPIQEQRRIIGEIAAAYLVFGNVGVPPAGVAIDDLVLPAHPREASRSLRSLAGRLRATVWSVPLYRLWARCRLVPTREKVLSASQSLVGWSNTIASSDMRGPHREQVARLLRLPLD